MDRALYQRLRAGETGTWLQPGRALWRLSGADRVRYLNGQVTNDVARLPAGQALYAAVTTPKGKMVGDVWIAAAPDALLIDAPLELRETMQGRLEKYLISDDATLEDITDSWSLSHVFGTSAPQDLGDAWAFQSRRRGLAGFDVWKSGSAPYQAGFEAIPECVETLRLEHAIPLWGSEMTEDTLPPEAGLERNAIRYDKGCYVGQEVIARIKSIGHVNKHLCVVQTDSPEALVVGAALQIEGKDVGRVTSVGFSPVLEKTIALAYAARQHCSVGTVFQTPASPQSHATLIEPPLSL